MFELAGAGQRSDPHLTDGTVGRDLYRFLFSPDPAFPLLIGAPATDRG